MTLAEALAPDVAERTRIKGNRYFLGGAVRGIEGTDTARETLKHILVTLDDTVRAGVFAPIADDCEYCDYLDICGPQKEMRAARKKGDPRLAAFYRMREVK